METDEMKLAWQALSRQIERQNALILELGGERRADGARRPLRRLGLGQGVQIAFGVLLIMLFAPFWIGHRNSLPLLLSGLSLHFYGLLIVLAAAWNLQVLRSCDFGGPVLEVQRKLARLRAWKVRVEGPVFAVTGSIMWIPLTLIAFHQVGANLWQTGDWFAWWLAGSLAAGALASYGFWRVFRSPSPGPVARYLQNSTAGRNLIAAQAAVEEIARFARD